VDIAKHPVIAVGPKMINDLRILPSLKVNNMSLVAELTIKGLGVGLLDRGIAEQFIDNGHKMIPVLENLSIDKTPIHLLYLNKNPPARVRELINAILKFSQK
jgi:DNA-binding transcriptional LysR family regulator